MVPRIPDIDFINVICKGFWLWVVGFRLPTFKFRQI
jgi:hypothetical protein